MQLPIVTDENKKFPKTANIKYTSSSSKNTFIIEGIENTIVCIIA
jgi:hypothetical protein